jgi:hypothetical protein
VFEFSLKSLQLSYLQDLFFSIGGPFGFTRAGLPEAGLIGLSFEFINPEGSGFIDLNYFSFTDVNALQIEGIISFSQPLTVDEPITVWLLLCVVLITLIRRLQRESLFVSVLSSNTKEQTKKRN